MSNFKVLPSTPLTANQQRETFLPKIPQLSLPGQLSLLSYPVQQLIQQVQAFFEEPPIDRPSLLRVLKVIGCSLNDGKLMAGVEKVLASSVGGSGGQVYELMALWAGQRFQICDFLAKVTVGFRKAIIFLIFEHFLMGSYGRGYGIQQQLSALLSPIPQADLIAQLQKRYERRGNPLKTVVKKCKNIRSQHQSLKQLLTAFVSSCLAGKSQRLMEFSLTDEQPELEYLLEIVPSANSALISQLKQTITPENVTVMTSTSAKLNAVFQSATKEWLNEKNNYWLVVERGFSSTFGWNAAKVIETGKMVLKEGLASECLAVQLLYSYFQGKRFDFVAGDAMIAQQERENWTEVYRSIGQCSSHRLTNLIILNKIHAPVWWKLTDPRKSPSKPIRKLLDKHSDFLQEREKQLAAGNKKIEFAFSVFLITDTQTGKDHMLTLQQLEKFLTDGQQIPPSYNEEYPPFMRAEVKKEEVRKEHNIIIEARLVRILKRAKEGLNIDALTRESGFSSETVELGVKRLVSKSLAEEDGKGGFTYLA